MAAGPGPDLTVSLAWGRAHELVLSLLAFLIKSRHRALELGREWVRKTETTFPDTWREAVSEVRRTHLPVGFVLGRMVMDLGPDGVSAEDLLGRVEGLTRRDLEQLLDHKISGLPAEDHLQILQRTLPLLVAEWHERYFSKLEAELFSRLKGELASRRELARQMSTEKLVEDSTGGMVFLREEGVHGVLLVPQYHYRPLNIFDLHQGRVVCWYPTPHVPSGRGEICPELVRMGAALSDPQRLRILKLLSEKSMTFTELASSLDLAKSTVHHHVTMLKSAQLLRMVVSWERGTTLELRPGIGDRIQDLLQGYLDR